MLLAKYAGYSFGETTRTHFLGGYSQTRKILKNDLSFIISSTLNLYEHQSSINPNMPIRGFLYFARQYEAYIARNKLDIYNSPLVRLPAPKYVILYNGSKLQPDISELKLSDAFINRNVFADGSNVLECTATVLNINYGHNTETLNCCKRLHDYSFFVAKVNEEVYNGLSLKEAINEAVGYCIENDILADFLIKHKAEVDDMLLSTEGVKIHEAALVKEGYNTGYGEGAMSRQGEIDTLTAVNSDLKLANDRLTAILKAHGIDPNQQ